MFGVEGRDADGVGGRGVGCVYNGGCRGASFIIFTCNVKEQVLAGTLSLNFRTESQASKLFSPDRKKKWARLRKRWHIDCLVCASRTPGFRRVLPYIYVEEVQQCTAQSWRGGGEKLKCHVRLESLPRACFSWSSQCDPKTWSSWWFLRWHYDKAPPKPEPHRAGPVI